MVASGKSVMEFFVLISFALFIIVALLVAMVILRMGRKMIDKDDDE